MLIAGLTGGTGSGKSTAARRFETHGIAVVDADKIGHALIRPGGVAVPAVLEVFGEAVQVCGTIDRAKLGAIVFSEPQALAQLNSIMQPLIAESIGAECASHAEAGASVCIVDAALIGDSGELEPWLNLLILVSSPVALRVQRLITSRALEEADARQRIAAQVDPERKRALARWVLENDGTLEELYTQVDQVAVALLSLSRSR